LAIDERKFVVYSINRTKIRGTKIRTNVNSNNEIQYEIDTKEQ